MKISIIASGTRDDLQPLLALSKTLKRNGHSVCMAAAAHFNGKIMNTKLVSLLRHPVAFLAVWTLVLFLAILLSVFLHEMGHGIGARLEGVHVSTGFNQVGDPGRSPDDPGFRAVTETRLGNVLGGLLGPMTSWGLAILFTVWLYRFKQPSWGAMVVSAMAITNGFVRTLPTLAALFFNQMGMPRLEDEIQWGMWVVVRYCQPPSLPPSMGFHAMLSHFPGVFHREPVFWIAPLISLLVSLACLIPAYLKTIGLWRGGFSLVAMWLFALLPVVVHYAAWPVLNTLDRLVRINW